MIERDMKAIFEGVGDQGVLFNRLVDEFRQGRDANELLIALNSDSSEVMQMGIWILGELPFDRYNFSCFIDRLHSLSYHEIAGIRFNSLSALYPSLDSAQRRTRDLVGRLLKDPDFSVRLCAEATADKLGLLPPQLEKRTGETEL